VASIRAAVREESAATRERLRTAWLDIDGVEHHTRPYPRRPFLDDAKLKLRLRGTQCPAAREQANEDSDEPAPDW
jgi:hypothetical protein